MDRQKHKKTEIDRQTDRVTTKRQMNGRTKEEEGVVDTLVKTARKLSIIRGGFSV